MGCPCLFYRFAPGNLWQRRAEYDDHTTFSVDRYGAVQAFYDALRRKPYRAVTSRSIQRLQSSDLGGTKRKHSGWCCIPGSAFKCCASRVWYHQYYLTPNAPDSTGNQVSILSLPGPQASTIAPSCVCQLWDWLNAGC